MTTGVRLLDAKLREAGLSLDQLLAMAPLAPIRGSRGGIEAELMTRPGIDVVCVADDPERHLGLVAVAYFGETDSQVVEKWLREEIGSPGQRFVVTCYGALPGGSAFG